ncbi:MAG TPA: hypothetical protein VGB45_05950, partial [Abditibacterium sp.]
RFDLTTPVDFESYRENGFLRLRLRFRDAEGNAGNAEGMNPNRMNPDGERPRRGDRANLQINPQWRDNAQFGGALPPFGGGPDGVRTPEEGGIEAPVIPAQTTSIDAISVTLLRENGATGGTIPVNLDTSTPDENGWRLFVLPIKGMTSTPNASGQIQRVIITSDQEDTFYMAQAAIVIENGQMTASIRRPSDVAGAQVAEIEVKPGPLTLIADVEAGAADPAIEWNFDADNVGNLPPGALSDPAEAGIDAIPLPPGMGGDMPAPRPNTGRRPGMDQQPGIAPRPGGGRRPGVVDGNVGPEGGTAPVQLGPRLDARGLTATFEYPNEEQNYRVEVTVRDRSGQKEPVTASILVRVRG